MNDLITVNMTKFNATLKLKSKHTPIFSDYASERTRLFTSAHGRRLRGDWGDGSPKFEMGTAHMHPSPQYFEK